jgi:voltage-gated potassium channel
VPGLHALIDVRVLRLLRIFRILKLGAYVAEFGALGRALAASRRKILVFLSFVMMVVLVMGTLMYVVEGAEHGFTSIPVGVYWAITTMTTVGFGDITPQDRPGTADRLGDDADRLGHAGRADRHRQCRIHRAEGATGDHHPRLP